MAHSHEEKVPSADARAIARAKRAIIVEVPPNHFGHRVFLGRRSKHVLYQGPVAKPPWLTVVETWPMDLAPDEQIVIEVTANDGLTIVMKGTLQWYPDPEIKVLSGPMRGGTMYPTRTVGVIKSGLEDQVAGIVGAIAGVNGHKVFIEGLEEVSDLLNSVLRLKTPLHMEHAPGDALHCGLAECTFRAGIISAGDLVDFYRVHRARVAKILEEEPTDEGRYSEVERTYGIHVVRLALQPPEFDAETKRARSEAQQAELRKEPFENVLKGLDKLVAREVTPDVAASLSATLHLGPDNVPHSTTQINIAGLVAAAKVVAAALNK
jgi:hypothetical protein